MPPWSFNILMDGYIREVRKAVARLSHGKDVDIDGITSEMKYGGPAVLKWVC